MAKRKTPTLQQLLRWITSEKLNYRIHILNNQLLGGKNCGIERMHLTGYVHAPTLYSALLKAYRAWGKK